MLHALFLRSSARRFLSTCAALTIATAALFAQTPSVVDGFDPNVDGNVYAVAVQPDGRAVIAGQFANAQPNGALAPTPRNNVARFNIDGTLDTSFNPDVNGPVRALVIQPNGQILIGGNFSTVGGVARNRVARLHANGAVDASFDPNITGTIDPNVFALALQADGAVVVGGYFTSVQPAGAATATPRQNLARFTSTGALDASWNPSPSAVVLALKLQADGKLLVGGGFTSVQASGSSVKTTRNRVARLNVDGTLDTFDPNANNAVQAFAFQDDGKILIGGSFTTVQEADHARLARLNPNGTVDTTFVSGANGTVRAIGVAPDGGVLLAGSFVTVWGNTSVTMGANYFARLTPDGFADFSFAPAFNGEVAAFDFQPDGRIVVGGYFTRGSPFGTVTPVMRGHVARLNPNGTLDATFAVDAGGRPLASVVQSDGKIVVAGSFGSVGGEAHHSLVRLTADGSVDPTFNGPLIDDSIYTVAALPDGKLLIGGAFNVVGGTVHSRIARLNADGTVDTAFAVATDGPVSKIVVQADGSALVGGAFGNARASNDTDPVIRVNILRLAPGGAIDAAFTPAVNGAVAAIAVQPDGKILLGGGFTIVQPNGGLQYSRSRLARLNADGSLDLEFNPAFSEQVAAVALQGDGKILVGGRFSSMYPSGSTELALRNGLARLNADGTLDTGFDPRPNNSVLAIVAQSDGGVLIGGTFTLLQPAGETEATTRRYIARVTSAGAVDESFDLRLDQRSGNRVDSLTLGADGKVLVGGSFASLQPDPSQPRVARADLARIESNGALDTSFELGAVAGAISTDIRALVTMADRKVFAAGEFSELGGVVNQDAARFNPEGTIDVTFSSELQADGVINAVGVRTNSAVLASQLDSFAWLNPDGSFRTSFAAAGTNFTGTVNAAAIDNQGRILLGGPFTVVTAAGTQRHLARFNPDGTLDTSFKVELNDTVLRILVQPDNKILIFGPFSAVGAEIGRGGVARLNDNGTLDTAFHPKPNGLVLAAALQPDGKILIGGQFTGLEANGAAFATRNYLARLEPSGSLDASFNPNPNATVYVIARQSDGKILVGGEFGSLQPGATGTPVARTGFARLNADGSVDETFTANVDGPVLSIHVAPDDGIVLGGSFLSVTNAAGTTTARGYIARLSAAGAVDADFNPNANGPVNAIVREAGGSYVVVGDFGAFRPRNEGLIILRDRLARITSTGTIEPTLNPDFVGSVMNVNLAPDGSLLLTGNFAGIQPNGLLIVGGEFTNISGVPAQRLALLSDDGSVNGVFLPNPNAPVHAILPQPDGGFVVGGEFTTIAGATRDRLARFSAENVLDAAFTAAFDGPVYALARQADGRILVAGGFSNVNGVARAGIARLNADGSLDASFIPLGIAAGTPVRGLAVQPDGRIVFYLGSEPASGTIGVSLFEVRRLNADGSDDASFTRALVTEVGAIKAISVLADGRILVGGSFPSIGNSTSSGPAYLARLNANGTIDAAFNPAPNAAVTAIAPQADGRVNIAGNFSRVGGYARFGLARLSQEEPAVDTLGVTADRTTVIWSRSGPIVDFSSVTFETSTDARTWTPLAGTPVRMGGTANWQLAGQNFSATTSFYVRARGVTVATAGKSTGIHEIVREFNYQNPFGTSAGGAAEVAGDAVSVDPQSGIVQSVPPAAAGVYFTSGGNTGTILGAVTTNKVIGAGEQVGANIVHANGNIYDQILLEGAATTITADPGEIVRASYADLNGDVVQVEFSGAGSLSIVLDATSGPAPAANYNQPSVSYMTGHAAIIIVGANETTNVSIFSVGPLTAVDQSLFRTGVTYDGVADLAYLAITSADGKFGSIRTGNVNYFATRGLTGIYAPGVNVADVVNIGDINGYDSSVAMLVLGSARQTNIAGGDLSQPNGHSLTTSGVSSAQFNFIGGMTSHGRLLPAQVNRAPAVVSLEE